MSTHTKPIKNGFMGQWTLFDPLPFVRVKWDKVMGQDPPGLCNYHWKNGIMET